MDREVVALADRFGWRWDEQLDGLELKQQDGRVLGWIHSRPHYCDRGHWCVGVEVFAIRDLDGQDAFPRYFMRLETAKQELVEFLAWRLHKVRA